MAATQYKIWQMGGAVGHGVMGSQHIGVAGVAKPAVPNNPFALANEIVCGELGRVLRLPIPPGFIVEDNGTRYHVSLNFNLAGQDLPPADAAALVQAQPDLACGIILFDTWVVNRDRHRRNLAFDTSTGRVSLFDHSHAFLSGSAGRAHLVGNHDKLGIGGHCLAREVTALTHMPRWSERISAIPEYYIREVVQDARDLGLPNGDADFCIDFLLERRGRLLDLVQQERATFPKCGALF